MFCSGATATSHWLAGGSCVVEYVAPNTCSAALASQQCAAAPVTEQASSSVSINYFVVIGVAAGLTALTLMVLSLIEWRRRERRKATARLGQLFEGTEHGAAARGTTRFGTATNFPPAMQELADRREAGAVDARVAVEGAA